MSKKKRHSRKESLPSENVSNFSESNDFPPLDPLATERMMQDLQKLLEQQDFESFEEANAFLAQFIEKPIPEMPAANDPLSRAQALIYKAYQTSSEENALKLAHEALEISPDCADAYVLLAEIDAKTIEEARDYYQKGVEAGERALGAKVFEEEAGHFWGIIKTRPYMRAREGLIDALWFLDEIEEAIEHCKEMLRLNPHDNQGIRNKLADYLLMTDRDEELEELLDSYEDDASANWLYSRALLLFRQEGESEESELALEEAISNNEYVPAYLLGKKKIPYELPAFHGFGDENEAIDYAIRGISVWRNTYGAIRWLRRHGPGRF